MKTYICQNCGLDFDQPQKGELCSRSAYIFWFFFLLFTTFIGAVILYFFYYGYQKKQLCPYCKFVCKPLLLSKSPMGIKLAHSLSEYKST